MLSGGAKVESDGGGPPGSGESEDAFGGDAAVQGEGLDVGPRGGVRRRGELRGSVEVVPVATPGESEPTGQVASDFESCLECGEAAIDRYRTAAGKVGSEFMDEAAGWFPF